MPLSLSVFLLALVGPTLVLVLMRRWGWESLSLSARFLLWAFAAAALTLLVQEQGSLGGALRQVGLLNPTYRSVLWGLAGAAALCLAAGATALAQRMAGLPVGDRDSYDRIARLPVSRRAFIVLTAAFVEEFLFRGIGLGIGAILIGNPGAVVISTGAFTLAHFRWRAAHLIQVALSGAILSVTYFLASSNLWSCILAHLIVDGLGFLLVPGVMKMRARGKQAL
jgi:membrane protease YdiL (CAAX protease family)